MPEIPTWAELRERHLHKAGGADDMSTFDDMSEEAQKNPQMPEQPWFIHVNPPNLSTKEDTTGIHGAPMFDPDKFVIPKDVTWSTGKLLPPQWYPRGGAFVSKENSGYRSGSTGYLDMGTSMGSLEDGQGKWTGWKVRLDPAHHQVLGDRRAYTDFLSRFSKPGPKGAVSPDWDRIRDAGIYSIEFPKSYFDSYVADGTYQDEQPSVMQAMFGEPQAFILDPRAVIERDTWSRQAYPQSTEDLKAQLRFKNPKKRTQPKLRESPFRKAGGADDLSDYEHMKEYSAENPEVPEKKEGEFIHTGVLSPSTTDYDPSKFTPAKNYRHLRNSDYPHYDPDSDDMVWADETVQMGLPSGGIYASKRNSKGQSHWMKMWHDRQSRWSNPMAADKYNGYQFDLSPQAKVKTVNSYDEYIDFLKKYPYMSYGGQPVRGWDNIVQHINSDHSAEHWPENWWKHKMSIDWEKLNDPETYGDDTYQAVYFTYPAVNEIYARQHGDAWPAGAATMDFEKDSDHMIILDPSIIQNSQPYVSPEFKYKKLRPKTQ